MKNFFLIVAGSRDFCDFEFLCQKLDLLLVNKMPCVTIVCGEARGADTLGKRYAKLRGLEVSSHPAQWHLYKDKQGRQLRRGNPAGAIRNREMAAIADALALFHFGDSPGSADMLAVAEGKRLAIREYRFTRSPINDSSYELNRKAV